MSKLQSQIKSIAKNLKNLSDKLEKLEVQAGAAPAPKKASAPKKKAAPAKKKAAAKAPTAKAPAAKAAAQDAKNTVLESVMDVIKKSKNGATIATLKAKTGLESRQLSNALYKLSKKGQIKTVSRGVYVQG